MTTSLPQRIHIAEAPQTGEGIAPDLATLIERMERARKFLRVEREYIRLVLMGGLFILFGTILTPDFPWRMMFLLALMVSPFLFGWYNLPLSRLSNAFRNETLPFLLRDYGKWNYSLIGTHFSKAQLRATHLVGKADTLAVTSIMTGERYGVPLQMAVLSVWPETKFKIYRGFEALFEGWAANVRLPNPPSCRFIILPKGEELDASLRGSWQGAQLTQTHNIFYPEGTEEKDKISSHLLNRLLQGIMFYPRSRYALSEGILWIMVPTDKLFFKDVPSFNVEMNNPVLFEEARENLASMFKVVDTIVWPHETGPAHTTK